MKVVGFTIIRNALKFDYPIKEAILSIAPLCDEVIVLVGNSDDDTLNFIKQIAPDKVKIHESIWDDSLRKGGAVLSLETQKAYELIAADADWCFYIQGDEVVHEKDYAAIRSAMQLHKDNLSIDGLLFDFKNFYGSYEYVADALNWVRKEVRIIRKNKAIYSYGDALGFRKNNNEKLAAKKIEAAIYHYGWVREPAAMQQKSESFHKMWHDDEWVAQNIVKASEFDYNQIDSLAPFVGTHPAVMQERIGRKTWHFAFDFSKKKTKVKYKIREWLQQKFNIEIGGFRNWKEV